MRSTSFSSANSPSWSVCGTSIMALRRPNGSLRPIAIGETIRRLTSKVAVDLITDRGVFEPLQLGVLTPNGCEASAVLQAVRTHFPSVAPWVDCCYRHESTLFTCSSSVTSQGHCQRKRRSARGPPWSDSFPTRHPSCHQASTTSSGDSPPQRHRLVLLFPR